MKKVLLILAMLLIYILGIAQPNGHGQGDPCKNPNNPNCAPIEGVWIILEVGIILGIYMTLKDKLWKNQTLRN